MKTYTIPIFKKKWLKKSMNKRVSKIDNKLNSISNKLNSISNKIDGLVAETNCKIEIKKSAIQKANDEIISLQNDLKEITDLKSKLEK